jgi:cobalt-zinc-cadmium efflux system outer membrane protein
MKHRIGSLIGGMALLLAACASVPGDAGRTEIQSAVSDRTGSTVDWTAPSTEEDPRIRALLQEELTADNAVAVAMASSSRLQATLAELGIARADLVQASVVRNPLFEAEIRFPRDPFRPFELRLAQTLVDLLQLPRRRALGRAAFDEAKLGITSEIVRFAADVRARHAELLGTSQRALLGRVHLDAAKAAAELAQRQHDAGNITDLDLEEAQAQYDQSRLDAAREETHLVVAREALLQAMGIRDGAIELRLPAAFPPLPPAEPDQEQLERLAAARRLDIGMARGEVEMARARVPLARLAVLGDITADVHFQRDANGAGTAGPGIEVPVPIFNTGTAARSRAEGEYLRARHTLNALLSESSSQLRAASAIVTEARARVESYRDVVIPRRQRIVALTILEHNGMLAGAFQLLRAKQGELEARRDSIDAQRDYWAARNDLERVLNGVAGHTSVGPADESLSFRRSTTSPKGGH